VARICGVCLRPPREGEEMRAVRLFEEDCQNGLVGRDPGLYSACMECVEEHRVRVALRMECEPSQVSNNALC